MNITLDPNHTFSAKKLRAIITINRMNLSHIEGLLFFVYSSSWLVWSWLCQRGIHFYQLPFLCHKVCKSLSPLSMQFNRSEASSSGKVAPVIMLISLPGLSSLHLVTMWSLRVCISPSFSPIWVPKTHDAMSIRLSIQHCRGHQDTWYICISHD